MIIPFFAKSPETNQNWKENSGNSINTFNINRSKRTFM